MSSHLEQLKAQRDKKQRELAQAQARVKQAEQRARVQHLLALGKVVEQLLGPISVEALAARLRDAPTPPESL